MSFGEILANHFDPAVYNSQQPRESALRWSPTLEIMRQGTCWHGAGVASTRRQHQAVALAEAAIYPGGNRLIERRVWQAEEPNTVFMEWRSEGTLWTGRPVHNGGLSIFEFAEGQVQEVRVFTNTAYLEAIERGWSDRLPIDVQLALPAYHTLGLPPIEWKPHPPSRQSLRIGKTLPVLKEPLTLEQRFLRQQMPGQSYFDLPPEHRLEVAPDGYTEFQGTSWYLAGRNDHRAISDPTGNNPVAIAQRALFNPPGGRRPRAAMSHAMAWATVDDPCVILNEWVSDRLTCTGRVFRNHGATVYSFDERGRRIGLREYTNIAYLEAVHVEADVRGKMGDAFYGLKASGTWDTPSDDWRAEPIPDR